MKPKSTVNIFVASSSELKSERKEAVLVFHELRKIFPSLYLEAVEWETDLPYGSCDKQSIQEAITPLLEKCALVVVIFYSKIGTYTLEEYHLAREKNKKVFLYFKSGFSPKDKTECDSYGEVLELRDEIVKENQLLFKYYDTLDAFTNILYRDLSLYISKTYVHPKSEGNETEQVIFPELPVLVVDDDKHFLNKIDSLLRTEGINQVECCDDSSKVMPLLESSKYSIILLELEMQGITGEELLKKIQKDYRDIPVIILTAIDNVEMAVNCIKLGAVDYLVKPVDTEKLIKTIIKYLEDPGMIKLTKIP